MAEDPDNSIPQWIPGLRLRFTILCKGPLLIDREIAEEDDVTRRSTQSLTGRPLHVIILSPGRRPAREAGDAGLIVSIDAGEKVIYSS